jgi:23S rRNA pseudouridine2605 synthase
MSRPKRPPPSTASAGNSERGERLQKLLAGAGHGSRRHAEELITTGRVEVDGQVVTKLGTRVDIDHQEVRVDGVTLRLPKRKYYALNKPRGILSTNHDPSGRPRIIDLLPPDEALFPVGRLDASSEGLIVVTNDGELANQLTHPRYGIEKTYQVEVAGQLEPEQLARMRKGVHLAEGFARVVRVSVKTQHKNSTTLDMVLDEGRNREVRRILARVGHKVMRLKRVAIGPLKLGELPPGHFRPLSHREVRELREAVASAQKSGSERQSKPGERGAARGRSRPKKAVEGPRPATVIGGDKEAPKAKKMAAAPGRKGFPRTQTAGNRAGKQAAGSQAIRKGKKRPVGRAGAARRRTP